MKREQDSERTLEKDCEGGLQIFSEVACCEDAVFANLKLGKMSNSLACGVFTR